MKQRQNRLSYLLDWPGYELNDELGPNLIMRRENFSLPMKDWHLPLVLVYPLKWKQMWVEKLHFLHIVGFLRTRKSLFRVIVFEKESTVASTNSDLVNLGSLFCFIEVWVNIVKLD